MADLIILTEAGGQVGYGHLMRCMAIAAHTNAEIYVHSNGKYPGNESIKELDWRMHLNALTERRSSSCPVMVDSYLAGRRTYELLAGHFEYVSVLDDYNRLVYPVDLIINPGIKLPDYKNQSAKVVGGNSYIILRNEIRQYERKTDYSEYRNLLITFGGCDASFIFEWLVPLIMDHSFMTVTVITGNDELCKTLSSMYSSSKIKWHGEVTANDMAKCMYLSDVCISAGGQTLHELAYIGVPTICVKTGDDQKNNIEGYIKSGFLKEYLSLETIELPQRINHLLKIYNDVELRKRVAESGKLMVDGYGAKHIAEFIIQLSKDL